MIDPRVPAICEEYSIEIIDGRAYPDIRQTRAVATMDRILRNRGEDHFRMVMSTLAETANNQGQLDEYLFWAVSDLVEACKGIIEDEPIKWLEVFDATPVGQLQYIARDLSGITHQRHALAGMLYERVVKAFGPSATQPDLFDERRSA
ncbi:hypothetical protein QO002_002167 [Pararhizobium capsulatum DSM 1112]|uniref:Uncharacterized protein n=1 Tax=Pararhizobium capsulatum DSM 1112 TaxID=1121113 RepID=A0ABU0BP56_9HYPH|nr:hypothetical protein [Pararhizobium capsulatum]MDQ0320029.1 hypothetical protein [Pararhizobium capsulatum DSM 1112]